MLKKNNIQTYKDNLEGLQKRTGLNKQKFSEAVGVKNAFRTEIKSLGAKIFLGIVKIFPEITQEWLYKPHPEIDFQKIKFTPCKKTQYDINNKTLKPVCDLKIEYEAQQLNAEGQDLINKAIKIIQSETPYSSMLVSGINAFYQSLKECADLKNRIEALEKKPPENPTNENTEKKAM